MTAWPPYAPSLTVPTRRSSDAFPGLADHLAAMTAEDPDGSPHRATSETAGLRASLLETLARVQHLRLARTVERQSRTVVTDDASFRAAIR